MEIKQVAKYVKLNKSVKVNGRRCAKGQMVALPSSLAQAMLRDGSAYPADKAEAAKAKRAEKEAKAKAKAASAKK